MTSRFRKMNHCENPIASFSGAAVIVCSELPIPDPGPIPEYPDLLFSWFSQVSVEIPR
jgi:hypothetical protein